MKFLGIISYPLLATFCILFIPGCSRHVNNVNTGIDTTVQIKPILTLPERQIKVYIGISDRWHEMADPLNYSNWTYVRNNASGFYTNFIAMWKNNYQNTEDPQLSCIDMRKAFVNNGCFFETSLETKVTEGTNGGNNEVTDKQSIDILSNAGFSVENTSLNYGVDMGRVNTLKTYNGLRGCLALEGPWLIGGDIQNNATAGNKKMRQDILSTDGVETDGPLGFWVNDSYNMKEGSYSLAKFAIQNKKLSAIMLSPSDAGITTYNPTTDFLKTSKQCVLGHEDSNASPDMWTIWTYGERTDEPTFPEFITNANGYKEPANSLMGVGYWLLKHLNNFPKFDVNDSALSNNQVTVSLANDSSGIITFNKAANGYPEYILPLIISNDLDPEIEISPIVHSIISGGNDWDVSFNVGGKDVTDDIIYNGGLNCINNLRLSKINKVMLNIHIKAKNSNSSTLPLPMNIKIETMSNISYTKNVKSNYTIIVKGL